MDDPKNHARVHKIGKKTRVERVQLGVRMEKRMVKVLKAIGEYFDLTLGDVLEGIVLHAFEGKSPFDEEAVQQINRLKEIYGMDYDSTASQALTEDAPEPDEEEPTER